LKQTSLNEIHKALGAKLIEFAGWEMPVSYPPGTASEVRACRAGAGLFDVSHMGEFRVKGEEALPSIQYIAANDASRLAPGKAQYSLLLNEGGGVKDDIIVYRIADEEFLVVVNAGCKDKDWDWFSLHGRGYHAKLTDESDSTALLAVQGPKAVPLVSSLSDNPISGLKRFHFTSARIAGADCTASRTGYTGDDGFELFCKWDDAPKLWAALQEAGAVPCGLGARDVLRIEAAYPLYGHELTESSSAIVGGVQWAIKSAKPDFIGRDAVVKEAQDGTRRALSGLAMKEPPNAIAREGYLVFSDVHEEPIGHITSGTLSPTLGHGIAMANLGKGFADPGTQLTVDIRGRRVAAEVVPLPFYRNGV
jgi:aminomethyltransferase